MKENPRIPIQLRLVGGLSLATALIACTSDKEAKMPNQITLARADYCLELPRMESSSDQPSIFDARDIDNGIRGTSQNLEDLISWSKILVQPLYHGQLSDPNLNKESLLKNLQIVSRYNEKYQRSIVQVPLFEWEELIGKAGSFDPELEYETKITDSSRKEKLIRITLTGVVNFKHILEVKQYARSTPDDGFGDSDIPPEKLIDAARSYFNLPPNLSFCESGYGSSGDSHLIGIGMSKSGQITSFELTSFGAFVFDVRAPGYIEVPR